MGICSCCTSCIAKGILGIVNSLFLTVGILLTIFGALFYWGQQAVFKWVSSVLDQVFKSTAGAVSKQISLDDIQLILGTWSRYLTIAGLILFSIGILLAGLAIVGYIGMCCEIKVLVIAYTAVVGAFGLGCIGIVIGYVAFKRDMVTRGQTEMLKLLQSKYINSSDDFTTVMDLIQIRMPCCGVSNYTDFISVPGWNRTYKIDGDSTTYNLTFPISCCKISGQTMRPDNNDCVRSPNANNSNYLSGGCYTRIWDGFDVYSSYIMYALCVAAAICACIVVLAIVILCDMFD